LLLVWWCCVGCVGGRLGRRVCGVLPIGVRGVAVSRWLPLFVGLFPVVYMVWVSWRLAAVWFCAILLLGFESGRLGGS
jgi:hypothetical protein